MNQTHQQALAQHVAVAQDLSDITSSMDAFSSVDVNGDGGVVVLPTTAQSRQIASPVMNKTPDLVAQMEASQISAMTPPSYDQLTAAELALLQKLALAKQMEESLKLDDAQTIKYQMELEKNANIAMLAEIYKKNALLAQMPQPLKYDLKPEVIFKLYPYPHFQVVSDDFLKRQQSTINFLMNKQIDEYNNYLATNIDGLSLFPKHSIPPKRVLPEQTISPQPQATQPYYHPAGFHRRGSLQLPTAIPQIQHQRQAVSYEDLLQRLSWKQTPGDLHKINHKHQKLIDLNSVKPKPLVLPQAQGFQNQPMPKIYRSYTPPDSRGRYSKYRKNSVSSIQPIQFNRQMSAGEQSVNRDGKHSPDDKDKPVIVNDN